MKIFDWVFGHRYDVAGKTVLITGAGNGIGRELAMLLHARGASLVVADVDGSAVEAVAKTLATRVLAVGVDVADRTGMRAAIDQAVGRFGHLDVVVANAGITPEPATLRTMDPEDFDRVIGINLTGAFNTVHPALDEIVAARGHVVVVSSCAAFAPGMGGASYMMSKAAVEQMGRALRVELAAHGASAGVAYFGVVDTQLTHRVLDADPLGHELDSMLPWPLDVRITAAEAARTIADGISARSARTIAPSAWEPYALLRGAINVGMDSKLAADPRLHDLLRRIEQRARTR